MPERWADFVSRGTDVLAAHPASAAVFDFSKAPKAVEADEEENEPFHTPPAAAPTVSLDLQLEEECELFDQEVDEATGKAVYTAGRTLMGRNAAHTIFMLPKGRKGMPWCFLLMWDGTDSLVTLYWPQARVEVHGEHLSTLDPLVAMQRISIWRCFDAAEHRPPNAGEPVIRAIRFVPVTG